MDDWLFIPSIITAALAFCSPGFAMLHVTGLVNQAAFDNYCSTVACFASAAPLWNMGTVYRTKTTDSMPSPIVAGLMLSNAAIGTGRTIFLAKTVNLNLAVLLHLACWCLRRAPRLPSAVDQRPLLENQTEDDHRRVSGSGQVSGDGRGLGLLDDDGLDMDNEALVDVTLLQKEIAQTNNDLPLHQGGQLGQLDIAHGNNQIVDLPLHQDGQHGLQEVALANNQIVDLPLHQDGQHGVQEEPTDLVAAVRREKDKADAINAAEVKLAQTVTSDEKVDDQVDSAVPQQGENAEKA